ncbi:hypothetical protein AZE42_10392 [Rhizopogon vesiculosus]|uniref:Uncharacterized protein n=1 Tax=Rhizopogon vesiculosus TaxID=180088 RepID=A0A1J8Q890_9AGAM|nr:hypothetical protein AZE42_10392 [Rhizopogon vesiculosus]
MMNIIIEMPHVEPTSILEYSPRTPFESPLSQLEHHDSSTTSMTIPSPLQQPSPPILLIPSTPTAYYKSTQTPDIPSLI